MPNGTLPEDNYLGDGERTTGEFQGGINELLNYVNSLKAEVDALSSQVIREAAVRGVGTGANELPANSDLGDAAYLDIGSGSGLDADTVDGIQGSSIVQESRSISSGSGLSGGGDLSANRTISHANTSSQSSVNNGGSTFIQDISLDTFGHVTSIGSSSVPVYTPPTSAGAVGTYSLLSRIDGDQASPNTTLAGSSLQYSSAAYAINTSVTLNVTAASGSPSGTWRCMSFLSSYYIASGAPAGGGTGQVGFATLWLRIA